MKLQQLTLTVSMYQKKSPYTAAACCKIEGEGCGRHGKLKNKTFYYYNEQNVPLQPQCKFMVFILFHKVFQ